MGFGVVPTRIHQHALLFLFISAYQESAQINPILDLFWATPKCMFTVSIEMCLLKNVIWRCVVRENDAIPGFLMFSFYPVSSCLSVSGHLDLKMDWLRLKSEIWINSFDAACLTQKREKNSCSKNIRTQTAKIRERTKSWLSTVARRATIVRCGSYCKHI